MRKIIPAVLLVFIFSGTYFQALSQYSYACEGGHLIHVHGIDGYVDAEDPNIDPSGITLAAWVKCDVKNSKDMAIIYREFDAHQQIWSTIQYGLVINHSGEFAFIGTIDTTVGKTNTVVTEYNTRGQADSLSSGFVPDTGIFYHVAVTLDPISFSCNIYVNGVLKASKTMKGGLHWAYDGSGNQYNASIGAGSYWLFNGSYYNFNYFQGYIDDVFESGFPLNKSQIDSIAGGKSLKEIPFMNYLFNEGTGSTTISNPGVQFNSGNYGNTGTLMGDCAWVNCNAGTIVANAGPDGTITFPKNDIILDGSASYVTGSYGPITTYNWSQISGPGQSVIISPNTTSAHITFPVKGSYTFTLQIKDQAGHTATSNVNITVLRAWANVQDSLALVDLYQNVNGINWFSKSGWLAGPVQYWQGVTISDDSGRVTSLFESYNNLSGAIPASISNLTDLNSLNVSNNNLTFDGMELLAQKFGSFASYSPQDSIKIDSAKGVFTVTAGGTIANNTYNWFLNGVLESSIVGNASYTPKGKGSYYASVTNSIAKQLTLYSHTINNDDQLPDFKLIDPNPSLINSNGSLNNSTTNLDTNKIVIGGATDGITKIILFTNSKKPLTLSISDPNDGSLSPLTSSEFSNTPILLNPNNNGQIAAIYKVPNGLGSGNTTGLRSIVITEFDPNNPTVTKSIVVKLVNPPVILVHGMWSNPGEWTSGGFINTLINTGYSTLPNTYMPKSIYLVDYSDGGSNSTFDPGNPESAFELGCIANKITQSLYTYRSSKIAVTQSDIVCVGLGGLIARSYSQSNLLFINKENFLKGYFHKFITLGTPHRGTPYGPILWNHRNDVCYVTTASVALATFLYNYYVKKDIRAGLKEVAEQLFEPITVNQLMSLINRPIGTCHRDFGKDSISYKNLQQTNPFFTYSITGNGFTSPNFVTLNEGGTLNGMNNLFKYISGETFNQVFTIPPCLDPPNNDWTEEINSQSGGISKTKNFTGVGSPESYQDSTEISSRKIQVLVSTLLLSNDTTQFSIGFPAPTAISSDCVNGLYSVGKKKDTIKSISSILGSSNKGNILGDSILSVQIISPSRGTNYQINNNSKLLLQFSIQGPISPVASYFEIAGIGRYGISNHQTYDTTINIPSQISLGRHEVVLFVRDSTGLLFADTTSIVFSTSATLDSIKINPTELLLDSSERTSSVYIEGYFSDGQKLNLTNGSTGTTYYSKNNTGVFNVSSNGFISGNFPGIDTLIVNNNGVISQASITVGKSFLLFNKSLNSITFESVSNKNVTDPPFSLSATSISGNPVSFYLVSGPAIVNNGIVIIKGPGKVTIKSSDSGNSYFMPASDVTQSFCINPEPPAFLTFDSSVCVGNIAYKFQDSATTNYNFSVIGGSIVKSAGDSVIVHWTRPGIDSLFIADTVDGCVSDSNIIKVKLIDPGMNLILQASGSLNFCLPDSVILSTSGMIPLLWYLNDSLLTTLAQPSFTARKSGTYYAQSVPLNGCAAISDSIVISASESASIPVITPGSDTTFCTGGNVILSSSALSGNTWYKNDTLITGATSPSFTALESGIYTVSVLDGCGKSISAPVHINVLNSSALPKITLQGNLVVCNGASSTIHLDDSLGKIQWFKDSDSISNGTLKSIVVTQPGNYFAKITDVSGCSTNSDTAAIAIVNLPKPRITPSDSARLCLGDSVSLEISTSSDSLQWYHNGTALQNAVSNSISVSLAGTYYVTETSSQGCKVISDTMMLHIDSIASPLIVITDSSVGCADSITLKSNYISGNQWIDGTTPILGANAQSFIVTKAGDYSVKVDNISGCSGLSAVKSIAPGKAPDKPVITLSGSGLISSADSANHWYLNDTLLTGVTDKNYTPIDTGDYTVQTIINGCASPVSDPYHFSKLLITGPVVRIYPNPAFGFTTIENRSPNPYSIQIFDISGRLLSVMHHASRTTQVNISTYSKGSYILLITDEVTGIQIRNELIKL